jgi:hypothetical protein
MNRRGFGGRIPAHHIQEFFTKSIHPVGICTTGFLS